MSVHPHDLVAWANANAALIQAVTSVLLTVITAVYVVLTGSLVRESRRARTGASRPRLVAYVHPHEAHINLLFLVLENVGQGPAYNVHVELSGQTEVLEDRVNAHGLFTKGVPVFSPRARREVFVSNAIGNFDKLKVATLSVRVSYQDGEKESYDESFSLDFSQFEGFSQIGKVPAYQIASDFAHLRTSVERVLRSGRVEVRVHTSEDDELADATNSFLREYRGLTKEQREEVRRLIGTLSPQIQARAQAPAQGDDAGGGLGD